MFYYVSGTVAHMEPYMAVIDCAGVGYAVKTSNTTLGELKIGSTAKLYTYLHVREDIFELYGFFTQGELNCFKQLISVSGVGPKVALSILSTATAQTLALSVITGDEKALQAAPGVGKKMAQRIILELKGKLEKEQGVDVSAFSLPVGSGAQQSVSAAEEAAAALAVLGYSPTEVASAMKGLNTEGMSVEEIIKAALKNTLKF